MKQYEYNVLTNRYHVKEEVLNLLGKEGWELISHTYTDKSQSIEDEHIYIFKREKVAYPKGIAYTLTAYQGEDPVPLYDGKTGEQLNKKKFKLDDSFKKALEEAVVSDTPASSWMEEYKEAYDHLRISGMFWEFHPTWTGIWDKDKYAFCHDRKFKKK
jgi:hypothetical protein